MKNTYPKKPKLPKVRPPKYSQRQAAAIMGLRLRGLPLIPRFLAISYIAWKWGPGGNYKINIRVVALVETDRVNIPLHCGLDENGNTPYRVLRRKDFVYQEWAEGRERTVGWDKEHCHAADQAAILNAQEDKGK